MSLVVPGEARGWAIPAAEQARARTRPDTRGRATFPEQEVTQGARATLHCS